jgi:hypothetical protein
MRTLIAKDLKIKFIETLNELDKFSYEEGNPFLIKIGTKQYFVFLKNLSPAYFKNSPDVTRVQLPYSDHFSKIFKADIPFIILGYDVDTDTVVTWNPKKVKERLNAKSNVSLYARSSLQEQVKDNEFKFGYLSNGEKIVLFKRENLINYFDASLNLFKSNSEAGIDSVSIQNSQPTNKTISNQPKNEHQNGNSLSKITDKELLKTIRPLLNKNQVLQAVEITSKYYGNKFKSMSFKDWYKLVNELHKKITS